jgi:hypothetical protein
MIVVAGFTDWLTGIAGALVFFATAGLAVVAFLQMRAATEASARESDLLNKQIEASMVQGNAIREAARAQLQPVVFAHGDRIYRGPDDEVDVAEGEIGFSYRLANEGTGIALNIRHGVEIDGNEYEFGAGMQMRVLRADERQPPPDYTDELGHERRFRPIVVAVHLDSLPPNWTTRLRHYWTRYQSVFGEYFETRNPSLPDWPAEFRQIDEETLNG